MKIKALEENIRNGNIYVILNNSNKRRCLYKDGYGYYCRIEKVWDKYLVERFDGKEDLEKIENFLKGR